MGKQQFQRGEVLSAGDLNEVARAAQRAIVAGQGIKIDQTPDKVLIHAVMNQREDIRYGRVDGCSVGSGGTGFPDDVTYSLVVDGIDGIVENTEVLAIVNRPAYGTECKIVAQLYGSDVLVWMRRDEEGGPKKPVLIVLTEKVKRRVCGA
jgi:hypothetical protein